MLQRGSTDFRASCSTTSCGACQQHAWFCIHECFCIPLRSKNYIWNSNLTSIRASFSSVLRLLFSFWNAFIKCLYWGKIREKNLAREPYASSSLATLTSGRKKNLLINNYMHCTAYVLQAVQVWRSMCAHKYSKHSKTPFIHLLLSQTHRMRRVGRDPQESLHAEV